MGPKKKQVSTKSTTARSKSKSKKSSQSNSKVPSISPPPLKQKFQNDSVHEDEGYYSGNSQSQASQLLLGRKNRLNDLLSTSQQGAKTKTKTNKAATTITKRTSNKSSFEEDDGFIYKRSQSVDSYDSDRYSKKKKQISTPIAQLQEEMSNISKDDEDLELIDLPPSKKVKRSSSRPNSQVAKKRSKKSNGQIVEPARKYNSLDETSLQLSSPIQSPKYNNHDQNEYSSDEYVEQVSHHKLTLADSDDLPKTRGKKTSLNKRRSSYYNRGKRVSSIGNGFEGEPHEDVPVSDYYKLLDTSLPEPDRMRQLLIWCFKKKLDQEEKELKKNSGSTEDQTVINIAKVIKEEILRDLMEKQISTSWYSNIEDENDQHIITSKEITVPNPQNLTNLENIDIYSAKLKNLIKEKKEWQSSFEKSISSISNISVKSSSPNDEQLREYLTENHQSEDGSSVNFNSTVIDNSLFNKINDNYQEVSHDVSKNLESSVDRLFEASYQLKKTSELVESLQKNKLNDKVSSLLKNYVTKNSIENYRKLNDESSTISWPIPTRPITTREILRAITRLDNPNK